MKRTLVVLWLVVGCVVAACAQDPNVKKQQYLERGVKYHAEGKHNEAILQFKNALQIDPKFVPAALALGRAYRAKSWSSDAVRELRRAVELDPANLPARRELAEIYLDIDAWDSALAQAKAIEERAPDDPGVLYIRGAALQGKGQSKEAL